MNQVTGFPSSLSVKAIVPVLYPVMTYISAIGGFYDQGDARWIVKAKRVLMICPSGGQPLAGLTAARGLAALRACLVFLVTIN
jgi:hypothetical protein